MKKIVTVVMTIAMMCLFSTTLAATAPYHSSDNRDIAQKGNSGVYAYASGGMNYDIYYIVDFDEGYVYYFLEGEDNNFCDRVKIDSGTLNDVVIITYHDGEMEWSYGLHFKWVRQPDHLIVEDSYGFENDYYATGLERALDLRDNKTITDY